MPQLVPFFFINQVTFALILFLLVIYFFSKNILPVSLEIFSIRATINKL